MASDGRRTDDARRPKVAVVLFNLGGPDNQEAVRPFLMNLFTDPAILRVPPFVRPFLARYIAHKRVPAAQENYRLMGGGSPLLPLTEQQAGALEVSLAPDWDAKCFIAMRYWHPFSDAAVQAVKAWGPDEILLLPLYAQFSTTTTGSSLIAWREAAARAGLAVKTTTLCCWFDDEAVAANAATLAQGAIDAARQALPANTPIRVLFSAHGLPKVIVDRGDPYQFQIEAYVAALRRHLHEPDIDGLVCYQSRATPQQWLGPSTDEAVMQAGRDGCAVVVVPVAFVSDHSETLVELDLEYRELAHKHGVPGYFRAPVQNGDPGFIAALAGVARKARARGPGLCSNRGGRACSSAHGECPFARAGLPAAESLEPSAC
ncbi:MAG TPA: ferrochelatase [Acidisoma sp.]|uniref:ferrochelatase n=1 Tax=Acidisoma sp. TaxID=1872115 RepID=UPI002B822C8C|nr:ferrochelatase [Acidisoma sp.]HTI02725.1 ferrochelatase [Acidisoma sp.]